MNTWQKCPVCDGKGKTPADVHPHYGNTSACSEVTCDVCKGARIISTINGLPPAATTEEHEFRAAVERAKQNGEEFLNSRPELRDTHHVDHNGFIVKKPTVDYNYRQTETDK